MRRLYALIATAIMAVAASTLGAVRADATCSVFDRHPCTPTFCSVFRRGPCLPDYELWIGQDLRLTIMSSSAAQAAPQIADDPDQPEHRVHSIRDMFAALRACWHPPDGDAAQTGMQMSVRFAFKRNGEIIAPPRVTYTSPDASPDIRETYHQAIMGALERCTPLRFSDGLAGAVVGRPIAIRFVDDRTLPEKQP
jgi:hypothetical protein